VRENGNELPLRQPTAEELARHIARYGNEGVAEVVRAYPLETMSLAAFKTDAPKGRRLTDEVRRIVLHFHAKGSPATAIAATLNLSERRVKDIIRQA
jgi:DNA-binding NarL/FixJ family response regulator